MRAAARARSLNLKSRKGVATRSLLPVACGNPSPAACTVACAHGAHNTGTRRLQLALAAQKQTRGWQVGGVPGARTCANLQRRSTRVSYRVVGAGRVRGAPVVLALGNARAGNTELEGNLLCERCCNVTGTLELRARPAAYHFPRCSRARASSRENLWACIRRAYPD